jgi:hypothetical protein
MDSRRKFRSDGNGNPNSGQEAVDFVFHKKNQSLTRRWPLDWRGCFGQGIKWDAPLDLDFGLGLWRLHTIGVQAERLWKSSWPKVWTLDLSCGGFTLCLAKGSNSYSSMTMYFQPISLHSQQSSATHSHGLSTSTAAIVQSGPLQ